MKDLELGRLSVDTVSSLRGFALSERLLTNVEMFILTVAHVSVHLAQVFLNC